MSILLYTWSSCAHCERARQLLRGRGLTFAERSLDADLDLRRQLARRLGRADMPFVLLEGELIGGVAELERRLASLPSEHE